MQHTPRFMVAACLLLAHTAFGQIQFFDGTWSEALDKAKQENKLIFLDAYTTWCAPCKQMDKEVFRAASVGEAYNANYLNVQKDMEKEEGIELAKKLNIKAYPTLFFINGEGEVVHRVAGYHSTSRFLELGNVVKEGKETLSNMLSQYEMGLRDPEFLKKYTKASFQAAEGKHNAIAEAYLETQKDMTSEENVRFIFAYVNDTDTRLFKYLVNNKKYFEKVFSAGEVFAKIQDLIEKKIYNTKPTPRLGQIDTLYKAVFPAKASQLFGAYCMNYYRGLGNREEYAKAAAYYIKKFRIKDPMELNETAFTFCRVIEDKEMLEKAVGWAKKSIRIESNYYNNETLASLYYKLGEKEKALKTALKAIELAKKTNEKHDDTLALIEKINAMK
jgi:thioredoxin-related protein